MLNRRPKSVKIWAADGCCAGIPDRAFNNLAGETLLAIVVVDG